MNESGRAVVLAVTVYGLLILVIFGGKQVLDATQQYAAAIQAIASVLALIGIVLLAYQIRSAESWNRLNAVLQLQEVDRFQELERKAIAACKDVGVRFPTVLTKGDAVTIRSNHDAYHAVKAVATFLDRHSVAYMAGYFDKPLYKKTFGPWIVGYRAILHAYVEECRTEMNDPFAYGDLVAAATELKTEIARRQGRVDLDTI